MKFKTSILVTMVALAPTLAHAYSSGQGNDPSAYPDIEKKAVAQASSASTQIAVGTILTYTSANDGYTVAVTGAVSAIGSRLIACVATGTPIASGGVTTMCATRGYINGVLFDTSDGRVILRGEPVCASTSGKGVNCAVAGSESSIVADENIPAGTTGSFRALLKTR